MRAVTAEELRALLAGEDALCALLDDTPAILAHLAVFEPDDVDLLTDLFMRQRLLPSEAEAELLAAAPALLDEHLAHLDLAPLEHVVVSRALTLGLGRAAAHLASSALSDALAATALAAVAPEVSAALARPWTHCCVLVDLRVSDPATARVARALLADDPAIGVARAITLARDVLAQER